MSSTYVALKPYSLSMIFDTSERCRFSVRYSCVMTSRLWSHSALNFGNAAEVIFMWVADRMAPNAFARWTTVIHD